MGAGRGSSGGETGFVVLPNRMHSSSDRRGAARRARDDTRRRKSMSAIAADLALGGC